MRIIKLIRSYKINCINGYAIQLHSLIDCMRSKTILILARCVFMLKQCSTDSIITYPENKILAKSSKNSIYLLVQIGNYHLKYSKFLYK